MLVSVIANFDCIGKSRGFDPSGDKFLHGRKILNKRPKAEPIGNQYLNPLNMASTKRKKPKIAIDLEKRPVQARL